jgi:hypothetical protein
MLNKGQRIVLCDSEAIGEEFRGLEGVVDMVFNNTLGNPNLNGLEGAYATKEIRVQLLVELPDGSQKRLVAAEEHCIPLYSRDNKANPLLY